jgi:16S rRNA (cytosine967-C5)-methyltransferase
MKTAKRDAAVRPRVRNAPVSGGGMTAVQTLAARAVEEVLAGRNLDRALETLLASSGRLTAGERAAVQAIAFSTVRHLGLLSAQLDALLAKPLSDAPLRALLLVALSQLQFSRAATHAIVDQAVDTAQAIGLARAKGLVNGVLRNFLRDSARYARESLASRGDEVARHDFPAWWIARAARTRLPG